MAKEKEDTTDTQETEEEVVDTSGQFKAFSDDIATKVDNISKVLDNFGREMGEDRKQRDTLSGELGSIKEMLESNATKEEESDFDPYNKEAIAQMIDERTQPQNGEAFLTQKAFNEQLTNMLSVASQNAGVKTEFGLNDDELNELVNKSNETGETVRLLAFDEFAERKFKGKDYFEKLSTELKQNDTTPPMDTASETVFDKTGIPSDPDEFKRWYDEKEKESRGSARRAMVDVGKGAK